MVKYITTTIIALMFLAGMARGEATDRFVAGLGELPLMPGLVEQTDQRLIYEKPDGRIITAIARGGLSVKDISAFYAETLPELGWRRTAVWEYRREKEILRLTITTFASYTEVQYKIAPE